MKSFCCGLAVVVGIAGCDFLGSQKPQDKKVQAPRKYTKEERITGAARILSKVNPLPSPLLDAHVDEKPVYDDMGWGPTDSTLFMYLKVAPEDMKKWDGVLGEKESLGTQSPESEPYSWWFEPQLFPTLEGYHPWFLLRLQGSVYVSRKTGEIWVVGLKT